MPADGFKLWLAVGLSQVREKAKKKSRLLTTETSMAVGRDAKLNRAILNARSIWDNVFFRYRCLRNASTCTIICVCDICCWYSTNLVLGWHSMSAQSGCHPNSS